MPVAFNCKSGEVAGDSWNLMPDDSGSKRRGWQTKRTACWILALSMCLGLLLLSVILVGHNASALSHWEGKYENLISDQSKGKETDSVGEEDRIKIHLQNLTKEMQRLQKETSVRDEPHHLMIHLNNLTREMERLQRQTTFRDEQDQLMIQLKNLTREMDRLQGQTSVRDERDRLRVQVQNLTQETERLQDELRAMRASRDKFQQDVHTLTNNRTGSSCLPEWTLHNNKCYYVSPTGRKETWSNSRKDCLSRGADLVTIKTRNELTYVRQLAGIAWIGLSDSHSEGQWKWVDGTYLEGGGFWQPGEPNDTDENEDCVEVSRDANAWNDAPCNRKFSWVCQY